MNLTRLVEILRRNSGLLVEFRSWREKWPELTRAMVAAGEAHDRRVQVRLARWLMEHHTDVV